MVSFLVNCPLKLKGVCIRDFEEASFLLSFLNELAKSGDLTGASQVPTGVIIEHTILLRDLAFEGLTPVLPRQRYVVVLLSLPKSLDE